MSALDSTPSAISACEPPRNTAVYLAAVNMALTANPAKVVRKLRCSRSVRMAPVHCRTGAPCQTEAGVGLEFISDGRDEFGVVFQAVGSGTIVVSVVQKGAQGKVSLFVEIGLDAQFEVHNIILEF